VKSHDGCRKTEASTRREMLRVLPAGASRSKLPTQENRPRINRAFSLVVDDRSTIGTEDSDFQSVTSMASRVKGMTDKEKDEFIRLINGDEEQDFAEA
jgi:hypothetical protein